MNTLNFYMTNQETKEMKEIPILFNMEPNSIDWVICGCESGHNARDMDLEWSRDLQQQCQAAEVPFFMKQLKVHGKARLGGKSAGH